MKIEFQCKGNQILLLISSFRAYLEANQQIDEATTQEAFFKTFDFLDLLEEQFTGYKKALEADDNKGKC